MKTTPSEKTGVAVEDNDAAPEALRELRTRIRTCQAAEAVAKQELKDAKAATEAALAEFFAQYDKAYDLPLFDDESNEADKDETS
jgi:hypothetical protein